MFFALLALLKAGDRIVAARQLFGSCHYIVADLLPKYGVQSELVDGGDLAQWEKALSKPAQAVLFESPSNPMLDIVDVSPQKVTLRDVADGDAVTMTRMKE